jgi:hypothetical protein
VSAAAHTHALGDGGIPRGSPELGSGGDCIWAVQVFAALLPGLCCSAVARVLRRLCSTWVIGRSRPHLCEEGSPGHSLGTPLGTLLRSVIGWAQRALPIAVDTRPVRNRGYTGPIKSRFDAVTNAHPARKLVNTLSHLSRFFELRVVHTHFLTIRAKCKGICFLASAAVLPK